MRLLLKLVVSLALTTPPLLAQPQPATIAEQYLLAAANADRASRNLPLLQRDPALAQAALSHARQMAAHAAISHQFAGEPDLSTRGAAAGARFSLITENIASASATVVIHDLWMKSAGHRANLLDPNVSAVGIAIVLRNHQFYAVEDFARTVRSLTLAQQESAIASLLSRAGIPVAETSPDARKTCAMSTGYAGTREPWFIMRFTAADLTALPNQLRSRLDSGRYHQAVVGACTPSTNGPFTAYNIAVLLYP